MKKIDGFTTVEILITLFVAVLFLMSGYQLYTVVLEQSADTRRMSEASNIGYEILRKTRYASVGNACSTPTTLSVPVRANNLPKPVSATVYTCKPYATTPVMRATVTVIYGSGAEKNEVSHAIYLGG